MPKLVCDPPPEGDSVEYYTLAGLPGDPTIQLTDALVPATGEMLAHCLLYDLSTLEPGAYQVRVSACNQWTCSLPAPLGFTVPEKPSTVAGLDIMFI